MVQIRKARRSATKARVLIPGASGSGKTYSSLLLAKGMGCKRVIVIDTEHGSSDLYDRLLDFDVIDLGPPFTPERYIEAIDAAEEAGADCIIIDSISHEWSGKGGCLELVDDIARARFKGNTWSAWSELTPRHRAFIDRMLRSSAHIIATGRSKTETAQVEENGRKKVVKLGMKTETRDGVEFEFTAVLDLVHDGHYAVASKDRTGVFSGDPKPITVETGRKLAEWLASGVEVAHVPAALPASGAVQNSPAEPDTNTVPMNHAAPEFTPPENTPLGMAKLAISKARTLDALDAVRKKIDVRVAEKVFTQAEADDLVGMCRLRAEMLIGEEAVS